MERNVSLFVVNNAQWKQIFKESPDPIYRKISETMIVKDIYAYIDENQCSKVQSFLFVFLQEYTQGPCPNGKLMVLDRETGFGKCSCDSNLVYYTH